jgi:hypothetical protein
LIAAEYAEYAKASRRLYHKKKRMLMILAGAELPDAFRAFLVFRGN